MLKEKNTEVLADKKKTYSVLYDRYSPALYAFVLKLYRDPRIAEQVLLKTFVRIWKKLPEFDPSKERVFSWMMKIAIAECTASGSVSINEIKQKLAQYSYQVSPGTFAPVLR